jgi:hypothetical protein
MNIRLNLSNEIILKKKIFFLYFSRNFFFFKSKLIIFSNRKLEFPIEDEKENNNQTCKPNKGKKEQFSFELLEFQAGILTPAQNRKFLPFYISNSKKVTFKLYSKPNHLISIQLENSESDWKSIDFFPRQINYCCYDDTNNIFLIYLNQALNCFGPNKNNIKNKENWIKTFLHDQLAEEIIPLEKSNFLRF